MFKDFYQHWEEDRLSRIFKDSLGNRHEPSVRDIFRKAAPYLDDSFEGEAILSIGKAVDLIERGAAGVVNAMPFGCMPGTIVSALMRSVQKDFDAINHRCPVCDSVAKKTFLNLFTETEQEAWISIERHNFYICAQCENVYSGEMNETPN